MGNPETNIKKRQQMALSRVGFFWNHPTGEGVPIQAIKALVAKYPEIADDVERLPRISFGFVGSSDTVGVTPITITGSMVGATVGVMTCIEAKTATGRQSQDQKKFEGWVNGASGYYAVERTHEGIVDRTIHNITQRLEGGFSK